LVRLYYSIRIRCSDPRLRMLFISATYLCIYKCGTCYGNVAGWLAVGHMSVLYQNG